MSTPEQQDLMDALIVLGRKDLIIARLSAQLQSVLDENATLRRQAEAAAASSDAKGVNE